MSEPACRALAATVSAVQVERQPFLEPKPIILILVRRRQKESGEKLKGLYPGQAKRAMDRPTAKRVLEAISRAGRRP